MKRISKKDFYEFLADNVCYNSFLINWRNSHSGDTSKIDHWIEWYMKDDSPELIAMAFYWKESPEGYDFWKQKDSIWREFCRTINPTYKFTQTKKLLWQVNAEEELTPEDIDHIKEMMIKMYPETENYDVSAKSIIGWKYIGNHILVYPKATIE